MPDRLSEIINDQLRATRASRIDANDPNAGRIINAMLRGQEPPPAPPAAAQPKLPKLGGADYLLADTEPLPGVEPEQWERWVFGRRVIHLLDQAGLLPGEPGYQRSTTGPADPASFDLDAAIQARRRRWKQRTGI